jgi:hypothetical protein
MGKFLRRRWRAEASGCRGTYRHEIVAVCASRTDRQASLIETNRPSPSARRGLRCGVANPLKEALTALADALAKRPAQEILFDWFRSGRLARPASPPSALRRMPRADSGGPLVSYFAGLQRGPAGVAHSVRTCSTLSGHRASDGAGSPQVGLSALPAPPSRSFTNSR